MDAVPADNDPVNLVGCIKSALGSGLFNQPETKKPSLAPLIISGLLALGFEIYRQLSRENRQ